MQDYFLIIILVFGWAQSMRDKVVKTEFVVSDVYVTNRC